MRIVHGAWSAYINLQENPDRTPTDFKPSARNAEST
jgi:hypothetical protein